MENPSFYPGRGPLMSAIRVNGVPIEALSNPDVRDRTILGIMGHKRCRLDSIDPEKNVRVYVCLECGTKVPISLT